jgi:uncharacterized membrane protein YfhO
MASKGKKQKDKTAKPLSTQAPPAAINYPSLEKILEGKSLYVFLAVAVLIVLIVFRNFLSFTNLYLYKDIGSDTITYWWPHWVNLSEYIHTLGVPKWSFNQGMGQNIYAFGIGDPFSFLLCLLPKDSIPFAIIFMEIFKIICGGLIFYLYLRLIHQSLFTSVTGGLLYSFCGYMILGSGWYIVSTETFYAVLTIYSGERFLRNGTWYLLPIPFCLLGALQPFYLYLYGLLLIVYCITRGILNNKQWKDITITLFKMGALAVFGVMLGSVVFFSNAYQLIVNPRVTGGASMFKTLSATPMFQLAPSVFNGTAICRMFSSDLLGAGSNFKGVGNYLEAPVMYVGLITLLLAPQAFLFFDKRKRKIYLILTAVCLVPMVFVYFRYMYWLFAGDFCRTYTFLLALLFLFFALKALSNIDRTHTVHLKTLIATLIVLLGLLYYNFFKGFNVQVDDHLRNIIAFFLVIYAALIYLLGNKERKLYAAMGIGLCLFIELASFSNTTVNDRMVMKSSELTEKRGYNDYTVDALAYINSKDAQFFRIAKDYHSDATMFVCLNDPQIQNYKGLTDYAEWNQFNYVSFLKEMHVPNNADSNYSKWLFGLSNRAILWSTSSVKYVFSKFKENDFISKGYDSVKTFNDIKVYRNRYFLPLGYTYKKYIPLSEFQKLKTDADKDIMLLYACVGEDSNTGTFNGMGQIKATDSLPVITFDSYRAAVDKLKKDTLTISHFDQNNIKGTIKTDDKEMLFLSIPYDIGWHAVVDGKPVTTYKVNIGFTGLLLDKGTHTIEMYFKVPYLTAGACTSAVAILLYAFAFIKYRKREF